MKIIPNLVQGSDEWLAHRRNTRNASDAPAMMGASPYVSRAELVRRLATGIEREVDASTRARFDRGHEVEPVLRGLAEAMLGEELYPLVGVSDDGYLGASFDGVTLDESVIFEAKLSNAGKHASIAAGEIPPADLWQIVQQFAVCESATRCLYLVGDGTEEGTRHLEIQRAEIEGLIPQLLAGWRQLDADVAAYVPEPAAAPSAMGRAPDSLPALSVVARGVVEFSNVDEFRERALAAIATVNRDLQTDEDFATAELTVKAFKEGEDKLAATKDQILGQMADVDRVMRTIDEVAAELRRVRLDLDKQVKAEKENRKAELVQAAAGDVRAYYDGVNGSLGEHALQLPQGLAGTLANAIKGKKSLASMKDALSAAAAQLKIEASQQADRVRQNVSILNEYADWLHIIPGPVQLVHTKQPDDLRNFLTNRVAEYQRQLAEDAKAELAKQEAERIRAEEQAKAELAAQNFEGITNDAGVAQPVEHLPSKQAVAGSTPAVRSTIKLGQINEAIAPLSITAAGLAGLGFEPVGKDRAAVLYNEAEFDRILAAMAELLQSIRTENRRAA